MATKTVRIDDLDETEGAVTHGFSLDGTLYEIDLSEENYAILNERLEPFIKAARAVKGAPATNGHARPKKASTPAAKAPAKKVSAKRPTQDEIREWARRHGKKVSPRGRIPRDVVDAFEAARTEPTTS